jgi:hypothetical protein
LDRRQVFEGSKSAAAGNVAVSLVEWCRQDSEVITFVRDN